MPATSCAVANTMSCRYVCPD